MMVKVKAWAERIKAKNAHSKLQWLLKDEESPYVTPEFVDEAIRVLEQEHSSTVNMLRRKRSKIAKKLRQ